MKDKNELPKVGMNLIFKHNDALISGTVLAITNDFIIIKDCTGKERIRKLIDDVILPIEQRTDSEKAIESLEYVINNLPVSIKCDAKLLAESLVHSMAESEFEYLSFTGDKK